MNSVRPDPVEDRPFPAGIEMTDWAGAAWKDLPPERAKYIQLHTRSPLASMREAMAEFLMTVPVGEGKTRDNFATEKEAQRVRTALYDAALRAWGTVDSKGKRHSNILTRVSRERDGTFTVEFLHLPPMNK